jgi:hypothetical protein
MVELFFVRAFATVLFFVFSTLFSLYFPSLVRNHLVLVSLLSRLYHRTIYLSSALYVIPYNLVPKTHDLYWL